MKELKNNCGKNSYNRVIDKSQLNNIIKYINEYISDKQHTCIDVPILMERDIQDGVFIEDNKIFKTPTKSIRYDLTFPLFIYYGKQQKQPSCHHGRRRGKPILADEHCRKAQAVYRRPRSGKIVATTDC